MARCTPLPRAHRAADRWCCSRSRWVTQEEDPGDPHPSRAQPGLAVPRPPRGSHGVATPPARGHAFSVLPIAGLGPPGVRSDSVEESVRSFGQGRSFQSVPHSFVSRPAPSGVEVTYDPAVGFVEKASSASRATARTARHGHGSTARTSVLAAAPAGAGAGVALDSNINNNNMTSAAHGDGAATTTSSSSSSVSALASAGAGTAAGAGYSAAGSAPADKDSEMRASAFDVPVDVPSTEACFFPDRDSRMTVRMGAVMAGHKRDLHACLKEGCACEGVFYKDFNCQKCSMLAIVSLHVDSGVSEAVAAQAWGQLRARQPVVEVSYCGGFTDVKNVDATWVPANSDGAATHTKAGRKTRAAAHSGPSGPGAWHIAFTPTVVTDRLNAICWARIRVGANVVDSGAFEIRTKPSEWVVVEGLPMSWTAEQFNSVMTGVATSEAAIKSTLLVPAGKNRSAPTGFARYAGRKQAADALFAFLESKHSAEQAGEGGAVISHIQSLNRAFKDKPDGSGERIAQGVRHPQSCGRGIVYAQVQVRARSARAAHAVLARRLTTGRPTSLPKRRRNRPVYEDSDDSESSGDEYEFVGAGEPVVLPTASASVRGKKASKKAKGRKATVYSVGGGHKAKRSRCVWDAVDPEMARPASPTLPWAGKANRGHYADRPVHLQSSGMPAAWELPAWATAGAGVGATAAHLLADSPVGSDSTAVDTSDSETETGSGSGSSSSGYDSVASVVGHSPLGGNTSYLRSNAHAAYAVADLEGLLDSIEGGVGEELAPFDLDTLLSVKDAITPRCS